MISFANAQIQGNVGTVEIKENNGKKFAKFSVATTESYKKGDEWVNNTHWLNVTTFNPATAEYIERNVTKGRQVFVAGQIKVSQYEKDGEKRTSVEIHTDDVQVGPKTDDAGE